MILPPQKVFLRLHLRIYLLHQGGVKPDACGPGDRRLSSHNRFSTLIDETEMEIESVPPPERSQSQDSTTLENLTRRTGPCLRNLCQAELQSKMFETVQDPIFTFNTVLTSIADRTIPKTSANPKHPSEPWFDDACDQAIGDRKKSERRFNQQPTTENLNNFRIFRAKARRTCRQARRTSWKKICLGDNISHSDDKSLEYGTKNKR
ncbi:Hypothetical predicted protein [Mytilus galloprovincialis]|uniref:Uncharacterized protein n=1 Tax=Mytilus galloprovincialis TaxID=29158 RepID=A0A8B6BKX4_MYTGA|nr:Hypothetical predicted protein [Mytilus galloprovincialis]